MFASKSKTRLSAFNRSVESNDEDRYAFNRQRLSFTQQGQTFELPSIWERADLPVIARDQLVDYQINTRTEQLETLIPLPPQGSQMQYQWNQASTTQSVSAVVGLPDGEVNITAHTTWTDQELSRSFVLAGSEISGGFSQSVIEHSQVTDAIVGESPTFVSQTIIETSLASHWSLSTDLAPSLPEEASAVAGSALVPQMQYGLSERNTSFSINSNDVSTNVSFGIRNETFEMNVGGLSTTLSQSITQSTLEFESIGALPSLPTLELPQVPAALPEAIGLSHLRLDTSISLETSVGADATFASGPACFNQIRNEINHTLDLGIALG